MFRDGNRRGDDSNYESKKRVNKNSGYGGIMRGAYGKKRGIRASASGVKNGDKGFPNETALVRAILTYFEWKGVLAWRMPVQGVMQGSGESMRFKPSPIRGFPDIAGVLFGFLFAIECKTERGRLSAAQEGWLDTLEARGGAIVRVVRPSRWKEDCDEILAEIESRARLKIAV